MKRILTKDEVDILLEMEDRCGVCNLLNDIFDKKDPIVYADINESGQIGEYEVIENGN